MKQKAIQFIPLALSILGLGVSFALKNPLLFKICARTYEYNGELKCFDSSIRDMGDPLFSFFLYAVPVTLVFAFVRREIFITWLKNMIWFVPLEIWNIFRTDVVPHGFGVWSSAIAPTRDGAAIGAGQLLILVTIIVIAWKYWRLQKKKAA